MFRFLSGLIIALNSIWLINQPDFLFALPTRTPVGFPQIIITNPLQGQALQGQISIQGAVVAQNFSSAQIEFSYIEDQTDTWFLISDLEQPVDYDVIAMWDTSTITDGNYNIRITVHTQDGQKNSMLISNLRVRNYNPIETNTPQPIRIQTSQPLATQRYTSTPIPPSPTTLPTNPAQITKMDVQRSLERGVLLITGFFLVIGVILWIRRQTGNS
jgi:hypothetical protein